MFSFLIVVFQLFFIIMIGAFYRSNTFTDIKSQLVTLGLITILGFVLMNSTYRKLNLFSLVLLLFISFFTIELNLLFTTFWNNVFTYFDNTVDIDLNLLSNSIFAALAVIITCLDFIGLFQYWQVFSLIAFIMNIGFAFSSALVIYGLDTYDGGYGIATFLFSGMCSLMIWLLSVRGKISVLQHKKSQSYINYTLGFIGVCITLFSWPVLNVGGSNLSKLNTNLNATTSLNDSAYINTFMALGVPLIVSFFLASQQTQSQKLHPKVYIQCFINAGIVVASFQDITLHPVAGMTMALFSTFVTIIANKYLVTKTNVRNESDFKMVLMKFSKILFRIIWSFIGVCIGAIVAKTRSSTDLPLLNDQAAHGTKAGLMIAGWIIVAIIGLIFGAITSVLINFYINYRTNLNVQQKVIKITDQLFFDDLQTQRFPIYKDILQVQPDKTYEQDLTRRILHQSLLQQQNIPQNIYQTNKKNSNHDTESSGKIQKQTLVIKNDFSKSNLFDKNNINLSQMKRLKRSQQPIANQIHPEIKIIQSKTTVINGVDTPVKLLQPGNSRFFQSQRPVQNKVQDPKFLKTNRSTNKLAQIQAIEEQSHDKNGKGQQPGLIRKKLTFDDQIIEEESIGNEIVKRINS